MESWKYNQAVVNIINNSEDKTDSRRLHREWVSVKTKLFLFLCLKSTFRVIVGDKYNLVVNQMFVHE